MPILMISVDQDEKKAFMNSNMWGLHGCDYLKCSLLRSYKLPKMRKTEPDAPPIIKVPIT